MCGLNQTHPFAHEDCIIWGISMKLAIPTHHAHGTHAGNAAMLQKYREEQDALRRKFAKEHPAA